MTGNFVTPSSFLYNTVVKITGIKTRVITTADTDITQIIDKYITQLSENSVVAITSKIMAISQRRIAPLTRDKDELIEEEAAYFLPRSLSKYNLCITISHNMLGAAAGIDESNANGSYVLWPRDLQESANTIRSFLQTKFNLKHVGVIITDSKTTPMRWGVTGMCIAHSGFEILKHYDGTPDIFGRLFQYEKLHIGDSLASASVLVMGEGNEQTPLAIIEDLPFVSFQDRNPTKEELDAVYIGLDDDLYAPLLTAVSWKKGKQDR